MANRKKFEREFLESNLPHMNDRKHYYNAYKKSYEEIALKVFNETGCRLEPVLSNNKFTRLITKMYPGMIWKVIISNGNRREIWIDRELLNNNELLSKLNGKVWNSNWIPLIKYKLDNNNSIIEKFVYETQEEFEKEYTQEHFNRIRKLIIGINEDSKTTVKGYKWKWAK